MFISKVFLHQKFCKGRNLVFLSAFALIALALAKQAIAQSIFRSESTGSASELSQSTLNRVNDVDIQEQGAYRYIEANGIPDHSHGSFPNSGNPHEITTQNHSFRIPVNPAIANRVTQLNHSPFGVAINGVIFDPGTAEY